MAAVARLLSRAGALMRTESILTTPSYRQVARFISTSNKNKDSVAHHHDHDHHHHKGLDTQKLVEKFAETRSDENWISYGYSETDKEQDKYWNTVYMFAAFTLCICGGGFILAYMPDHRLASWSQREAYLELARREKNNLPLIDPNVVDPSRFQLPSDEELGDFEIKI